MVMQLTQIIESKTELKITDDNWKDIIYVNKKTNEYYIDLSKITSKNFPELNTLDFINNVLYRVKSLVETYEDDVKIGEYNGREIYVRHSYSGKLIIKVKLEDENVTHYKKITYDVTNNKNEWIEYYLNTKTKTHQIQGNDQTFYNSFIKYLIDSIYEK